VLPEGTTSERFLCVSVGLSKIQGAAESQWPPLRGNQTYYSHPAQLWDAHAWPSRYPVECLLRGPLNPQVPLTLRHARGSDLFLYNVFCTGNINEACTSCFHESEAAERATHSSAGWIRCLESLACCTCCNGFNHCVAAAWRYDRGGPCLCISRVYTLASASQSALVQLVGEGGAASPDFPAALASATPEDIAAAAEAVAGKGASSRRLGRLAPFPAPRACHSGARGEGFPLAPE
jgi:hypothetical protein